MLPAAASASRCQLFELPPKKCRQKCVSGDNVEVNGDGLESEGNCRGNVSCARTVPDLAIDRVTQGIGGCVPLSLRRASKATMRRRGSFASSSDEPSCHDPVAAAQARHPHSQDRRRRLPRLRRRLSRSRPDPPRYDCDRPGTGLNDRAATPRRTCSRPSSADRTIQTHTHQNRRMIPRIISPKRSVRRGPMNKTR